MLARFPKVDSRLARKLRQILILRKLQQNAFGDAADVGDDAGAGKSFAREEDARSECESRCHPVRFAHDARRDAKLLLADADRIAELDPEPQQQVVGNADGFARRVAFPADPVPGRP